MNLGAFHARISQALRRGTSLDDVIPLWVAESANLIETTRTWSWMKRTSSVTTDPNAEAPNRIEMPSTRVKSFEYIKWAKPDPLDPTVTIYEDLKGVDPIQVTGITNLYPAGFWLDGLSFIWLDANPAVAIELVLRYNEFTDWPILDNAEPALLARGLSLLSSEVLLLASQENRDPRLTEIYQARRDKAFVALELSEQELQFHHQGSMKMTYVPR